MNAQPGRTMSVDVDLALPIGDVKLVRNAWNGPIDFCGTTPRHHLELTLLPRTGDARGCFPEYWGPNRFEPIGEVFLLPAERAFHARSHCRQQHSLICEFDPPAVDAWFDGELRWTERRLRGGLDISSARIRSLMFGMAEELRRPGFASETMIELIAAQLAIELSRHLQGLEQSKAMGGLAGWQLRRIDARIADGATPPSLAELAELCGISVRHLTRAFRASRGRSIGAYLEECRADQARRLLGAGKSVKAVAYELGYSAPSNFATAFRRATGESPREYQQRTAGRTTIARRH